MKRQQAGFTLIELISVIVILGILSAFAIPRFANLEVQAREASVEGLAGAIRSASALTHAVWLANGATGTSVTMEGNTFNTNAAGYPTDATIRSSLLEDPVGRGYQLVGGTEGIFAPDSAVVATCAVTYDSSVTPPTVTVAVTDCS